MGTGGVSIGGMQFQTHRDLYTLWGGGGRGVWGSREKRRKGPHSLLQALSACPCGVRERQREKRLRQMERARTENPAPKREKTRK